MPNNKLTYFIWTLGCQMNKSDSERITAVLKQMKHQPAESIDQADLVVINTCSVRQSAEDRVWGKINKLKSQAPCLAGRQAKSKSQKLIIAGCMIHQPNIKEKMKDIVDFFLDINNLQLFTNYLKQKFLIDKNYFKIIPEYSNNFQAYIPIMTGCNNFCTYCVVPYARGREISRKPKEILDEVKVLIKKGYKEITLLGQNVNSYQYGFAKLLKQIDNLPGKFWIRFITSHPKDMSDELIDVISKSEKICEYIHLPIQAGDDQILKRMNRKYTAKHYLKLIKKIRKKIPGAAISTDIIVGFPGETKTQFNDTAKIMRQVKFDMAYIAQYSPRPGTAAHNMKDDVPRAEKKRRDKLLSQILSKTALTNNKKYLGKEFELLVEKKLKNNTYLGKTRTFKNVKFKSGKNKVGEFVSVKITKVDAFGLEGIKKSTL